jgi:sterol 24-C-methyltransferase
MTAPRTHEPTAFGHGCQPPDTLDALKTSLPRYAVGPVVGAYETLQDAAPRSRDEHYKELVTSYYDLATQFYEFGWGQSFHFAPRHRGEAFAASLARHEFYLAHVLRLGPGMQVLDVGCGIGGPMRAIARFSGADITGVNNNAYQVRRGSELCRAAGLADRCRFMQADFLHIPVGDGSFDVAYDVEAACHAPDWPAVFSEIFRVLKAGAEFAGYEWCLTARYDDGDPNQRAMRDMLVRGTGLPNIRSQQEVVDGLVQAGFEIITVRDLAGDADAETPWWSPLLGDYRSRTGFRRTQAGRLCTAALAALCEAIGLAPKGSKAVFRILDAAADALVGLGSSGAFTPMLFFHARKP